MVDVDPETELALPVVDGRDFADEMVEAHLLDSSQSHDCFAQHTRNSVLSFSLFNKDYLYPCEITKPTSYLRKRKKAVPMSIAMERMVRLTLWMKEQTLRKPLLGVRLAINHYSC